MEVGELKGRFNFGRPPEPAGTPETGGTPAPRYAFETEDGGLWYLQLEKKYQGGRWEEAGHAEADYQRYKSMEPSQRKATLAAMWGGDSRIATAIDQNASADRSFSELQSSLAPFNTQRQISFGEPSPSRRPAQTVPFPEPGEPPAPPAPEHPEFALAKQIAQPAGPPTPTDIGGGAMRGLLSGPAALLKNIPIMLRESGIPNLQEELRKRQGLEPTPTEETPGYQMGKWIQEYSEKNYPVPKDRETNFLENLASGFAQMTNYLVGGVVAKQIQVSRWLVPVLFGQSAVDLYEQSKEAGMSDEAAYNSYLIGLGLDLSEAAPIARIFGRVNKSTGGGLRRVMLDIAKSAGEEATQEFLQESAQRKIEVERIKGGLPEGETSWGYFSQAIEAAEIGGIIGATMNILGMAAGLPSMGRTQRREARAKLDKAVEDLNKKLGTVTPEGIKPPPRAFQVDKKRIMGVFGTAPRKPNRVVLEDGTVVRRGEKFINSLQQYGYELLSQDQIDSLKAGAPKAKPLDVAAKEIETEVSTRLEEINTQIAALEDSMDLEASAAQETERLAKIERLEAQKRALTPLTEAKLVDDIIEGETPPAPFRVRVTDEIASVDEALSGLDESTKGVKQLKAAAERIRVTLESEVAPIDAESSTIPSRDLALRVANEITRMLNNLKQMALVEGIQPVQASVRQLVRDLEANGYELVDHVDKPFDERAKYNVVSFVEEPKLPEGEEVVSRLLKPQVNFNGEMIQSADVVVSQGTGPPLKTAAEVRAAKEDVAEPIFPKDAADAARERLRAKQPLSGAPEPPSDLISPEEAKAKAAESPELKAAEQELQDNAARLRAEMEAKAEELKAQEPPEESPEETYKRIGEPPEGEAPPVAPEPGATVTAGKGQAGDLAAATAELKKYTRDLGNEEALFGMAYRKWRLGGEFSVREDDPAILDSVFKWAQENPDSEQDIRSKTDAIVAKHKVGREGSIGDIRRAFYRVTAQWRQAEEEGKVPRPEAEPPETTALTKTGFSAKMDLYPDGTKFTITTDAAGTGEFRKVDGDVKVIQGEDYDAYLGKQQTVGEWEKVPEGWKKTAGTPLTTVGPRPSSDFVDALGEDGMSSVLKRNGLMGLLAGGFIYQPDKPAIFEEPAGEFTQFASFMDEQDPGTTFTLSRKDVPEISQVDKTPVDYDQWWGNWTRVDDPKGPIRWRNTRTGVEMLSRGFAPIGRIRMSDAIARSKRLKGKPVGPAKEPTPQVEALPGMTPLGLPEPPAEQPGAAEAQVYVDSIEETENMPRASYAEAYLEWKKGIGKEPFLPTEGSDNQFAETEIKPTIDSFFAAEEATPPREQPMVPIDQPLGAFPRWLQSIKDEGVRTFTLSSKKDFDEFKEYLDLTTQPEWKDVYIIGWRASNKGKWNLSLPSLLKQVSNDQFGNVNLQVKQFSPVEEWTDEYLILQPKEQLRALAGYRQAQKALLASRAQHIAEARTTEQKSMARQLVRNEARIWDKALKPQDKWTARELIPLIQRLAKGRQDLTVEQYKRVVSDLKRGKKAEEAPPPPAGEHPSVQQMADYMAELHTPGPGNVYGAPNYASQYFAARRLGGQLEPGSRNPGMTEEDVQRIESKIDSFFPDRPVWKEGDTAIWNGKEVEISKVNDPVSNQVQKVVVGTVEGDLEQYDATVPMNELTRPTAQLLENIRFLRKSADKAFDDRLEKIAAGPAPSRTLRIGRGAHGQVAVVFQHKDDADLFSAVGRMRRKLQGKGGPEGPGWPRLRELYPEGAENIGDFSQTYRDQIMEAIKGLPEGETFDAPRPTAKPPAAKSPQEAFDPDDPLASWPPGYKEAAEAELELSWAQRVVLEATATWKNTYAGKSNVRFTEANREVGITEKDWEEAKAQLMRDGYLRKNNSISPKGKAAEILPGKTTSEVMSVFALGRKPAPKTPTDRLVEGQAPAVAPGELVKPAYTNKDGQADFALRPARQGTPDHQRWVTPEGEQVTLDSVNFRDGVRGSAGQLEGATEVGPIRWPVSHGSTNLHDQEAIDHYELKPFEKPKRGSTNTIFTEDRANEARERLKKKSKGDQLNIGFDPQDMADMFALGGFHFEAGARDFATWSKKMIEDVGEWVRPMLQGQFNMIKDAYEAEAAKRGLPEPPQEPTIEEGAPTDAGQTAGPTEPPIQDLEGGGPEPLGGTPPQGVGAPTAGGEGGQAPGLPGERGDPGDRLPAQEPTPEPGPDPGDRPAPVHLPPGRVAQNPKFYRIKPDEIGLGGQTTKANNNIAAIETIKALEESGEAPTPEQLDAIAKFVGWGQLGNAINPPYGANRSKWVEVHNRLKKLLSDEEFDTARRSILNAHFTSPEMVKFMWDAVQKMGFKAGNVLEPSMGVGNFLGLAPDSVVDGSKVVGIELDQLTGAMAKMLYPGADIFVKGFQDVHLPHNSFDLVISNVPFGNYKVFDPTYKEDKIGSIHDYFIIKSLDKAKPGGLVAVITSMYTMDKKSSRMREMMAARADLVLGLRLPNNAFAKNAGTQVTTDLLIFRKRGADETRGGQDFLEAVEYEGKLGETSDTKEITINQYFQRNPEKMLGIMSARGSMYGGKNEPTLQPEGDLSELLTRALKEIPEGVFTADKVAAEGDLEQTLRGAPGDLKEGAFTINSRGNVKQRIGGVLVDPNLIIPKSVKKKRLWIKKNTPQLKALINLREATKDVLRVQQESPDDTMMQAAQKKLGKLYDQYESAYGLLRERKTSQLFRLDPQYPLLLALENYDTETKTAEKADIFNKRTLFPYTPLSIVSSEPREALTQVLGETGRADVDLISALSEKPREQVIEELEERDLIFENPETGAHEITEEYLSGYVVEKLKIAERAAKTDPRFQRNVDALVEAQPDRVFINGPDLKTLISVRLGSTWIPIDAVKDFVRHLDNSPGRITVTYQHPGTRKGAPVRVQGVPKKWSVTFPNRGSVANRRKWSGGGVEAQKLLQIALNQGRPKVWVRNEDGTRSIDREATLAAKAKMDQIKNEFESWAREDDKWSADLEQRYNDNMNQIRLRKYDGQHLIYPGMNAEIKMQRHQSNGTWRIISAGRALLAHPVGSGKTFEMIAAAMELRRMGMVKKSMFAVPNHLVSMWGQEFSLLYPGANVLTVTKDDFTPKNRQTFFNRIATGDWDAVILAHSQIERIPVSKERELSLLRAELNQAREALEAGRAENDRHFVKRMENTIARLEAKLLALMDRPKDPGILFEDMGVDMLFVDEAHEFKNLFFYSKIGNISGLSATVAGKATAMKLKTDYLLETNNNRGVVFATATPISNSMAEVYTMNRFMAPDVLRAAGIDNFDEWSANFGEVIEVNELSPDSQTYAQRSKYARFNNLNEMINQFRLFADVLKVEALNLPVPTLKGGRPTAVRVPSHEVIDELFRVIIQRAEALRRGGVDPKEDNWLNLTNDAKKISLDLRLYRGPGEVFMDHPDSKLNMAVETVFQIYEKFDKIKGTQMVFIDNFSRDIRDDSGKVVSNVINLYDDMIEKLEARGIPREQMVDIHDFKGSEARQDAFKRMNEGKIRILFGNRPSMGTGTNAQRRMVALHNLDQPWRPDQLEQGNGRLIRQGNYLFDSGQIDSVEIKQYITERSFDAYMFQILETKAKMVHAALAGELKERTITDAASDSVLNYSEMKAIASGNPDVKLQLDLSMEEARLQALLNENQWERRRSESDLELLEARLAIEKTRLKNDQKALETWTESDSGKIFSAVINGISFNERKAASQYLKDNPQSTPTVSMYGFDLKITKPTDVTLGGRRIFSKGEGTELGKPTEFWHPMYVFAGKRETAPATDEGMVTAGLIESVEHRARFLEGSVKSDIDNIARNEREQVQLRELMTGEFAFQKELDETRSQLQEVEVRLGMRRGEREDEGDTQPDENDPGTILDPDIDPEPRNIQMSQIDQPPTIPDVGAPTTEGAPAPPLEEETIRIVIGKERIPTIATKVADGLFVHINPAREGVETAEEGRQWSVTHGPSGRSLDNKSDSKTLAIRLAEKMAALGDWMRSQAEIAADTKLVQAVNRLIEDERGFVRMPFFGKNQKQAIPKEEIRSPDPMVEAALTATKRTGRSLWEGMKGFPGEVHRTWGAEFFYEFKVLKWPRFVEGLRRFADAPLDMALEATNEVKAVVKPLDHSQFQVFQKLVVGKDIRENLRREIPQGELTFAQMDEEIGRLESLADPLIMDRVQAHDAMMEEVGDDLIQREKMKPESRRAHYFTNRVIDHLNKLDDVIIGLPKNLKTPHRWYLKERRGHKGWHEADYLKIVHRYLMKVKMDNATDDFVDEQAQNLDAMIFLSPEERKQLFGSYGKPLPKRTYTLPDGTEYKGWQYREGNVLYPGKSYNEEQILEAVAEGLTTEEWQELDPGRDVLLQGGKFKVYLLPTEVADRLTEFKGANRSIWARAFVPYMSLWKRVTLDFAGIPFQWMNFMGDDINLYFEDIPALFKQAQAARMLWTGGRGKEKGSRLGEALVTATGRSRFAGEFKGKTEKDIMKMAMDARTIASSALWFEAHQMSPYDDPELSHITKGRGQVSRWLLPFPGAKLIERGSAFRESIPRLAKFLKDAERIDRGEKVVVKSTSIKGLTPIQAMGKASRNFTVDYGAVSPMFRDEVRGWMFPFATFYLKNFSNYKHRTRHHFVETVTKATVPLGALMLWNYTMFPEVEDDLSEWWKYMPHLNTGYKTEDGKDIIIAFSTPVEMAAAMIGLDRLPDRLWQIQQGKITYKEAAEGQLKDTLLGFPRTMIDLINPFAKAIEGVYRNKDPWSGRQIVPTELWGDRDERWPQTKAGQEIMAEFIMRTILSPYAQYVRTSRLQEPGEGIYKFLVEGPLDVPRALGYRTVDLSAGERAKWWDERGIALASVAEKLYDIEDAYLSWRRGELTNEQHSARRKEILTRGGPGPTDLELNRMERSSRVRALVLQDELRAEEDPKKRQAIILDLDELRYQQQLRAYRTTRRSAKPDVDVPEPIPRFFAPGTEAPPPPP